ncbi:hypothetical protein K6119_07625 [Paracrocinitomix mangrovi]|uniref:hypothetical protein n=1 Tax=Paracrocinitomix mangrovi TaxID=2862509 RepID=UPI001C8D03F9|nr:hypothetical protein [Paracrocinitomix mangrovi]UKN03384.1 hypothetical protein K6119_07625 [Paracrocinitomix mangrovi]
MVFIWRGAGIIVPIFVFISGWIVSSRFEDTRLGNPHFMGWTLLWAGIALTLIGLALWQMTKAPDDENKSLEPGEIPTKSRHDFFWIPVWIWGVGLTALSIYLIFSGGSDEETTISQEKDEYFFGEKMLHFHNNQDDTVQVVVFDDENGLFMDEEIPPLHSRFLEYPGGKYTVKCQGKTTIVKVHGAQTEGDNEIEEIYFLTDNKYDLLLVNVTNACRRDINQNQLEEIDWTSKVVKRINAAPYYEVEAKTSKFSEMVVFSPTIPLPLELEEGQEAFAYITIPAGSDIEETYLDSAVISICF